MGISQKWLNRKLEDPVVRDAVRQDNDRQNINIGKFRPSLCDFDIRIYRCIYVYMYICICIVSLVVILHNQSATIGSSSLG